MNVPTHIKSHFMRTGYVTVDRHFVAEILRFPQKADAFKRIIDYFGLKSAESQGLSTIITTFERIRMTGQVVYLYFDSNSDAVVGMLKVGRKKLFVQDVLGEYHEIRPLCCLDFYVHTALQRRGIGKQLFEHMLTHQDADPEDLGYDRPSPKLLGFLSKHYGLKTYVPQVNHFVVFNDYFVPRENRRRRKRLQQEIQQRAEVVEDEVVGHQHQLPLGEVDLPPGKRFTPPMDRHIPEPPDLVQTRTAMPVGFDTAELERAARESGINPPRNPAEAEALQQQQQKPFALRTPNSRRLSPARSHLGGTGVSRALMDVMEDGDEEFRYKPISQSPLRKKELNPYSHAQRSRYSSCLFMARFLFADIGSKRDSRDGFCTIFGWSDIHAEHKDNLRILVEMAERQEYSRENDILIVAGDVCANFERFREAMELLKLCFDNIVFCPGNAEMRRWSSWRIKPTKYEDSLEKFEECCQLCDELGIHRKPVKFHDSIWIVPVLGWYTPHFSDEYDGTSTDYERHWLDFVTIRWPEDIADDPNQFFMLLNQQSIEEDFDPVEGDTVVTFSHFLPRRDLLPSRFIRPSLAFVTGNASIEEFLRTLNPVVHVFGHSHVNTDVKLDGIRYVQNALAHPRERKSLWKAFALERPKVVHRVPLMKKKRRRRRRREDSLPDSAGTDPRDSL